MKQITWTMKTIYNWLLKIPGLPYWILAFVAGTLAVAYSVLFRWSELWVTKLASYNPYLFLIITPIGFLIAWFLVWRIAPDATGSGIPQVMAKCNFPVFVSIIP